jgi:16S rRNA pseudouridine516 synthase
VTRSLPLRRLDQLLANLGYCSRREARDFLRHTEVTVGGAPARDPSAKVEAGQVRVAGEGLDHPDGLLIALHKPVGRVCSHDDREGPRVYDLLPPRWLARNPPVVSIGRLDKETSGLLLLTDQASLVHHYTSPRHKVPKVYRARLDRDLPSGAVDAFASGTLRLEGDDKPCAPAVLRPLGPREAEVTLTEGRYHQVRRMFVAAAGVTVVSLVRQRFGNLDLGDLPEGAWRPVSPADIG